MCLRPVSVCEDIRCNQSSMELQRDVQSNKRLDRLCLTGVKLKSST